mmetsp:Transcript_8260/g.27248  ORF Transcript_8260/g.27248 Transcript_8260/m.27248 type:complete len:212 (-) Transcript_8260:718-1353(-)
MLIERRILLRAAQPRLACRLLCRGPRSMQVGGAAAALCGGWSRRRASLRMQGRRHPVLRRAVPRPAAGPLLQWRRDAVRQSRAVASLARGRPARGPRHGLRHAALTPPLDRRPCPRWLRARRLPHLHPRRRVGGCDPSRDGAACPPPQRERVRAKRSVPNVPELGPCARAGADRTRPHARRRRHGVRLHPGGPRRYSARGRRVAQRWHCRA